MNKPTPFRQAVNHLKSLGIIKRDNDLLDVMGISSKGALSAYIGGRPPAHVIDKFLDKYGEYVAHFFKNAEVPQPHYNQSSQGGFVPSTEVIADLKADKIFYQGVIEKNLASINTTLAKLVQIHESISSGADQAAAKRTIPIVDPKALNPEVPAPPPRKSGNPDEEGQNKLHGAGKKNKR